MWSVVVGLVKFLVPPGLPSGYLRLSVLQKITEICHPQKQGLERGTQEISERIDIYRYENIPD